MININGLPTTKDSLMDRADAAEILIALNHVWSRTQDTWNGAVAWETAVEAAMALASFAADIGEEWDGAAWIVRLGAAGEDTLADMLWRHFIQGTPSKSTPTQIVRFWLMTYGL